MAALVYLACSIYCVAFYFVFCGAAVLRAAGVSLEVRLCESILKLHLIARS